jgi:hypothetical protein
MVEIIRINNNLQNTIQKTNLRLSSNFRKEKDTLLCRVG